MYASDIAFDGGIYIGESSNDIFSELCLIRDCAISGCNNAEVEPKPLITLESCNNITIQHNDLNDNDGSCIVISSETGAVYSNCIINNNFCSRGNYIEINPIAVAIGHTVISENSFLLNGSKANTAIVLNGLVPYPILSTSIICNSFRRIGSDNGVTSVDVKTNACGKIMLQGNSYVSVPMAQPRNEYTSWYNFDLPDSYSGVVTKTESNTYSITLSTKSPFKISPRYAVSTNSGSIRYAKLKNTYDGDLILNITFWDGSLPSSNFNYYVILSQCR